MGQHFKQTIRIDFKERPKHINVPRIPQGDKDINIINLKTEKLL